MPQLARTRRDSATLSDCLATPLREQCRRRGAKRLFAAIAQQGVKFDNEIAQLAGQMASETDPDKIRTIQAQKLDAIGSMRASKVTSTSMRGLRCRMR